MFFAARGCVLKSFGKQSSTEIQNTLGSTGMIFLFHFLCALLFSGASANASAQQGCAETVLYLPLDERFATRSTFLNLAKVSPYCIITPPLSMLPSRKVTCDLEALHQWVDDNIADVQTMIISSEMYLYGGLINSRVSNESTSVIRSRADKLMQYHVSYPNVKIYVSAVVMRIPGNGHLT